MNRAIIGIGNAWRGDDAAGLLVVSLIRQRLKTGPQPPVTEVLEHSGEMGGLVDLLAQYQDIVLIDATTSGRPVGTLIDLDGLNDALCTRPETSSHGLGISEAIELARALGALPQRLRIYGIEGKNFEIGTPPSPAVRQTCYRLADQLSDAL